MTVRKAGAHDGDGYHLSYPESRQERILEIIRDVPVEDPFRRLEEESPETLNWQSAQNDLAERYLHSWEGHNRLRRNLAAVMRPLGLTLPKRAGDRAFRATGQSGKSRLSVSRAGGEDLIVLSPGSREVDDVEAPCFDWFEPSPNGRFVAYGSPEGGGLQGGTQLLRLRIRDVSSGADLPLRIAHVAPSLVWLPDSSGFYFVAGLSHAKLNAERRLFHYSMGEAAPAMEPLRGLSFCFPQLSADARYLSVVTGLREPRADFLLDRHADGIWRPFLNEVSGACYGCFVGEHYLAISTHHAPNGRVVAIPLDGYRDCSSWSELISESNAVLREILHLEGHLVVVSLSDDSMNLRLYGMGRELTDLGAIETPFGAVVSASPHGCWLQVPGRPTLNADRDGFSFFSSSMTVSPTPVRFELKDRTVVPLDDPQVRLDGLIERRDEIPADDGAVVRLSIAHRSDLDLRVPRPLLLYGYGAYNYASLPGYLGVLAPFALAGGIVVFAHVRGGGERGGDWWRAGHHEHKQRSFDDFYAVSEALISRRLTDPGQLAMVGLSNGGLNVCVALTQRPDLFKAGVALAPHCDLLRYSRDPFCGGTPIEGHHAGLHVNAGTWRDPGWGVRPSVEDPPDTAGPYFPDAMYPTPFGYSPYHNVRPDTAYPACLVVCGDEDLWCPPWHSRKFCARMQAATTSSRPILLRVWPGAGHDAPVSGEPGRIAEWLGFLMRQVGLMPAS